MAYTFNETAAFQRTSQNDAVYELNVGLRASLIAGLAGSQSPNSLTPTCTSGNCTFRAIDGITYSTAGLSTECIDISSLITQSGALSWEVENHGNTTYSTNYSLPNGMTLRYYLSTMDWVNSGGRWDTMLAQDVAYTVSLDNVTMTPRQREISQSSVGFDGIIFLMPTRNSCEDPAKYETYLGGQQMQPMPAVNASSCPQLDLPGVETLPGYFSVTAVSCFFYTSLQHYNGTITNGRLTESLVDDPVFLQGVSDTDSEDAACDWRCGFSDPCIVDNAVYNNSSANLTLVPGGLTQLGNTTGPRNCLYGFTFLWYRALQVQSSLYEIISGSTNLSAADNGPCVQFANYTAMMCPQAWWLSDIYNGGNASVASVNAFMKRGFDSFTAQLRTLGVDWDGNVSVAQGTVYEMDVCIQFRWQWLLYPLAMAVGALALLIMLVVSSSGLLGFQREAVWKESVLPYLYYGLQESQRSCDDSLAPEEALKEKSEAVKVRLTPGEDGWRLHSDM